MRSTQRLPGFLLALGALAAGCSLYHHAADDAGVREPCIEQIEPLTAANAARAGVSESALRAQVRGTRTSQLIWAGAPRTDIALTVTNPEIYYVHARINPAVQGYELRGCDSRAEISGQLRVRSGDGRLSELIADMRLTARVDDEAYGTLLIDGRALKGTYAPNLGAGRCLARVELRVLFAIDGIHGSLTDVSVPCDGSDPEDIELFASGHWGARWQNY